MSNDEVYRSKMYLNNWGVGNVKLKEDMSVIDKLSDINQ